MPAAKDALELCSLERIKGELRIPLEETAHDTVLTDHAMAAAAWLERQIQRPLLKTAQTLDVGIPGNPRSPLRCESAGVTDVTLIRYWRPVDDLRWDPGGSIQADELGRIEVVGDEVTIWPPAAGWPAVLYNSRFRVNVTRGLDTAQSPQDAACLTQAMILMIRQLYDGFAEIKPTHALYALIARWERY